MFLWFIILIVLAYCVGLLIIKEPLISESGIPQVEGVLLRKLCGIFFPLLVLGALTGAIYGHIPVRFFEFNSN